MGTTKKPTATTYNQGDLIEAVESLSCVLRGSIRQGERLEVLRVFTTTKGEPRGAARSVVDGTVFPWLDFHSFRRVEPEQEGGL